MNSESLDNDPANAGPGCSGDGGASCLSGDEKGIKENSSPTPVCLIVLGMAGSGKTTFVKRLCADLYAKKDFPYSVNLDPAVLECPFPVNIDIRDTVKYKEVMKQYKLGPNGGIMTSLNLFATRFDQVLELLEKRKSEHNFAVFDTPGQIEVFSWSASGSIIAESLAAQYPTVIVYVMDTALSVNPVTFMSNMLYACGILYKFRLPFLLVLNKADIISPKFAQEWMSDFEAFHEALSSDETESSYSTDLARSLSLVLDEFYQNIKNVAFSALTGEGLENLYSCIEDCVKEYHEVYRVEYNRLKKAKDEAVVDKQREQLEKLKIDRIQESIQPCLFTGSDVIKKGKRITIGSGLFEEKEEEEISHEKDEEEQKELESFRRFLSEQTKVAEKLSKSDS